MRLHWDGRGTGAIILGAMLMAAGGAGSVFGQTLPPGGEAAAASPWIGPWIGIAALGGWSTAATSELVAQSGAVFHSFDTLGAGGGGLASFGYDWRLQANSLIVGIVGDIGFLHDPGGQVFRTTTNLTGSGGVRLGFAASPALLLYAQSGIAFANELVAIDLGGPTTQQNRFTPGIAARRRRRVRDRCRPAGADRQNPIAVHRVSARLVGCRHDRYAGGGAGARFPMAAPEQSRRSRGAGPFLIDATTAVRRTHCLMAIVLPGSEERHEADQHAPLDGDAARGRREIGAGDVQEDGAAGAGDVIA